MDRARILYPTMQDDGTEVLLRMKPHSYLADSGGYQPEMEPQRVYDLLVAQGVPREKARQVLRDLMEEWGRNQRFQSDNFGAPPDARYLTPGAER